MAAVSPLSYVVNDYPWKIFYCAMLDIRSQILGKLTPEHRLLPIASTRHGFQTILETGLKELHQQPFPYRQMSSHSGQWRRVEGDYQISRRNMQH
jgi:hypothetical protein